MLEPEVTLGLLAWVQGLGAAGQPLVPTLQSRGEGSEPLGLLFEVPEKTRSSAVEVLTRWSDPSTIRLQSSDGRLKIARLSQQPTGSSSPYKLRAGLRIVFVNVKPCEDLGTVPLALDGCHGVTLVAKLGELRCTWRHASIMAGVSEGFCQ